MLLYIFMFRYIIFYSIINICIFLYTVSNRISEWQLLVIFFYLHIMCTYITRYYLPLKSLENSYKPDRFFMAEEMAHGEEVCSIKIDKWYNSLLKLLLKKFKRNQVLPAMYLAFFRIQDLNQSYLRHWFIFHIQKVR